MKLKIGNILICSSYILMAIIKMIMLQSNSLGSVNGQANMITFWALILVIQLAGLLLLGNGLSNFNHLPASIRLKETIMAILMIIVFVLNTLIKYDFFASNMGMYSALGFVILVSILIIITSFKMRLPKKGE